MTRLSRLLSQLTQHHPSAYVNHNADDVTTTTSPPANHHDHRKGRKRTNSFNSRRMHDPPDDLSRCAASFPGIPQAPQMEACLGIFDLVSLGVGSCLGTGMYLTAGLVASVQAGPGGALSFLVAGFASMLTGLCYAELAGLCPKSSGSAYMYAYVTVGELAAFIIGWGLVVEYVIGTAANAVALSETLDSLSEGLMSSYLKQAAKAIGIPKLDLLAAAICALLTWLLASGAEMSAKVNNGLNVINTVVLIIFVVASLFLGLFSNWGAGGFFPFGISGVVRAIPTCYFAFIGFDTLAATGAEARNPARSIPLSILLSIGLNTLAYVIVILTLTFDLPFYLLRPETAMTDVFPQVNFAPGKYVVAVGAVAGLFAATFGSLFPLPRILTAMASDGLVFGQLGKICPRRHTPVTATLLSGLVAIVMATFFYLEILIELVLIGTLLAYILVTFSLLYMRYVVTKPPCAFDNSPPENIFSQEVSTSSRESSSNEETLGDDSTYRRIRGSSKKRPNSMRRFASSPSKDEPVKSSALVLNSSRKDDTNEGKGDGSIVRRDSVKNGDSSPPLPASPLHEDSSPNKKGGLFSKFSLFSLSSKADNSESHPLLEQSHGIECDATDDVLYAKSQLMTSSHCQKTSKNQAESDLPHTTTNEMFGQSRENKYRGLPLWFKIVTDVVRYLSVSPFRIVSWLYAIYGVEIILCIVVSKTWESMADGNLISLGILGFLSAIFIVLVGILTFLPQSVNGDSFRAPLVPALPVFVAFFNIFLMTSLSAITWLLFAFWMSVGLLVYMLYGISHSQATISTTTMTSMDSLTNTTPLSSPHTALLLDDDDDADDNEEETIQENDDVHDEDDVTKLLH